MRTVIVHYHLFKNAGTTVDGILNRNFPGEAHGHLEGPYPWSTVSSNEILDFALSKADLRVISSHQARLPLPQHPSVTFVPVLFLRHPIDRFASVYEFERRQPADSLSPSVAVARNGNLAAFAEWTVAREATAVCRNFQVAHLAGAQSDMRYARATHDDYLQALAHLKSLPFFGMVESFEESLDSLQEFVRPHMGELNIDFLIENVSPGRKATLESRLEHIESELGASLYRELLELNALDLLLYHEAKQMFAANRARLRNVHEASSATGRKTLWQRIAQNFRRDANSAERA